MPTSEKINPSIERYLKYLKYLNMKERNRRIYCRRWESDKKVYEEVFPLMSEAWSYVRAPSKRLMGCASRG